MLADQRNKRNNGEGKKNRPRGLGGRRRISYQPFTQRLRPSHHPTVSASGGKPHLNGKPMEWADNSSESTCKTTSPIVNKLSSTAIGTLRHNRPQVDNPHNPYKQCESCDNRTVNETASGVSHPHRPRLLSVGVLLSAALLWSTPLAAAAPTEPGPDQLHIVRNRPTATRCALRWRSSRVGKPTDIHQFNRPRLGRDPHANCAIQSFLGLSR